MLMSEKKKSDNQIRLQSSRAEPVDLPVRITSRDPLRSQLIDTRSR